MDMKKTSDVRALLAFSLMLFASAAFAAVPQALTYRGVLLRKLSMAFWLQSEVLKA